MKSTVSALALAICLAACSKGSADTSVDTASTAPAPEPVLTAEIVDSTPSLEEARAFVAGAEKALGEFAVINSRAQ